MVKCSRFVRIGISLFLVFTKRNDELARTNKSYVFFMAEITMKTFKNSLMADVVNQTKFFQLLSHVFWFYFKFHCSLRVKTSSNKFKKKIVFCNVTKKPNLNRKQFVALEHKFYVLISCRLLATFRDATLTPLLLLDFSLLEKFRSFVQFSTSSHNARVLLLVLLHCKP